jgi:hypothetical protein
VKWDTLGVNKVVTAMSGWKVLLPWHARCVVRAELRQCDACARRKADFREG